MVQIKNTLLLFLRLPGDFGNLVKVEGKVNA